MGGPRLASDRDALRAVQVTPGAVMYSADQPTVDLPARQRMARELARLGVRGILHALDVLVMLVPPEEAVAAIEAALADEP